MAYGNTSALDLAASTVDQWMNEGENALDLMSTNNPLIAILRENSKQPGGNFNFRQEDGASGAQFRIAVNGKSNTTVDGVTAANQINAISTALPSGVTAAVYNWSHYQGVVFMDYSQATKNSGKSKMVSLAESYVNQTTASFYDVLGTDLFDAAVDAEDKIGSANFPLANASTYGGIDQTDTTNNSWWRAQSNSTAEIINSQTIDAVYDLCTIDTGVSTGVQKIAPDIAFFYGDLYSKFRQELKQSQRYEVGEAEKGGGQYILYNGMRCYRTTRITSGTVLILNSSSMAFRYHTRSPEWVTPGFVPVDRTPSMMQRGANWFLGFGYRSVKHNGILTNKTSG